MSDPVITVENLSKVYNISHQGSRPDTFRDTIAGLFKKKSTINNQQSTIESFHALRDVSFDVQQGEVLGIIGRNGAGKSTLLKILSRITVPTSGRVEIRGRVASLLEVGTGFHPELSGRENIFLNGAILGMNRSEIRSMFEEIVDFAGVEKFLDTPIKRYSSGMYVRLAFAVAAHLDPEILVVDEVLAVGDAEFQRKCIAKMKDVSVQEGRTVLFVSHNMNTVERLCHTGLFLNNGRAEDKTDITTVVRTYEKTFQADGSGSLPATSGEVTLRAFDLFQYGRLTNDLEGDVDTEVVIAFSLAQPLKHFRIGFVLKNQRGDVLWMSLLADWKPELSDLGAGEHEARACIPARMLEQGSYLMEVHASQHSVRDYDFYDITRRSLTVKNPSGYRPDYPADRPLGHLSQDPGWKLEVKT